MLERSKAGRKRKHPFRDMAQGDSVIVYEHSAVMAAYQEKNRSGSIFTVEKLNESEWRVTCTKKGAS